MLPLVEDHMDDAVGGRDGDLLSSYLCPNTSVPSSSPSASSSLCSTRAALPPPDTATKGSPSGFNGTPLYVTVDNLASSLKIINNDLAGAGLPAGLQLPPGDIHDTVRIANALHLLLLQHKRDIVASEDLQTSMKRIRFDSELLRKRRQEAETQLVAAKASAITAKQQLQTARREWTEEKRKLVAERDAARSSASGLKRREVQLNHELRRAEFARDAAKKKLTEWMSSKDRRVSSGMQVTAVLQQERQGGGRPKWHTNKGDVASERSAELAAAGHVASCQALIEENAVLRRLLRTLQSELIAAGSEQDGGTPPAFELPIKLSEDAIKADIRQRIEQLRSHSSGAKHPASLSKADDAHLRAELAEARQLLKEQEIWLQRVYSKAGSSTPSAGFSSGGPQLAFSSPRSPSTFGLSTPRSKFSGGTPMTLRFDRALNDG